MKNITNFIKIIKSYPHHNQRKLNDLLSKHDGMELILNLHKYICLLIRYDNRMDDKEFTKHINKHYGKSVKYVGI